jgi:hypothetical protein
MSEVNRSGRLGNSITRNIAGSIIAKKYNLKITYVDYELISKIGIPLFSGIEIYKNTKVINDNNYFKILNSNSINFNINIESYCQTKEITDQTHKYLNSDKNIEYFVNNNKYKDRYKNNNDCFIHIRLGDVEKWNPGFKYYDFVLSKIKYDNIFIATDSNNHNIIKEIQNKYKNVNIFDNNLINIFQFASTCRFVILSYGTFSAIIGYISFYSTVYYLKFCKKVAWDWDEKDECDMFRNKTTKIGKWIEIDIYE